MRGRAGGGAGAGAPEHLRATPDHPHAGPGHTAPANRAHTSAMPFDRAIAPRIGATCTHAHARAARVPGGWRSYAVRWKLPAHRRCTPRRAERADLSALRYAFARWKRTL